MAAAPRHQQLLSAVKVSCIAIISVGITGRLNASFEMARRLQHWGYSVVIASLDQRAGDRVRNEGLDFFPLDDGVSAALRQSAKQHKTQRRAGFFARRALRAQIARARGKAAIDGNRIDALIAEYQPQLLLVESELHDSIIYCQSLPVRMSLLEYHVSTRRMPAVPPLSSTLTPDAALFRLRCHMAWRWTQLKRRGRQRYRQWYLKGWDERSIWRRIADARGVNLSAIATAEHWPLLHYPRLPCIHLCAAEFDLPHPVLDTRRCVGPMVQKSRRSNDDDAGRCRALLQKLQGSGRPLVLCATGSILSLPAFLRKVLRAASGQPYDLIVATGRGNDPSVLGTLPPNVHAFSFVPQLEVLCQASLFICHGGISSIHEALVAGVPMLVYSGGCMDENGNAARVSWHGLGVQGHMQRDRWKAIRRNIAAVLGDRDMLARVSAMQTVLQRYEQAEALLDAIRYSTAPDDLIR